MAGTTTYYGISYPTSTDYVKDGATAMQTIATGFDSAVAIPTYNNQTGTTYTFVLADTGKTVTASNASASTYTIPPQSSVAWASGATLTVRNLGAGVVTFAGGAGVTLTNSAQTLAQYTSAKLIRTGSDAWTVVPESAPSGLSKIATNTLSSSATCVFTSLTAGARYRVVGRVTATTSAVNLTGRFREGSTDKTTGYAAYEYGTLNGTSGFYSVNTTLFGMGTMGTQAANKLLFFNLDLYIHTDGTAAYLIGQSVGADSSAASSPRYINYAAHNFAMSACNGINFYASSGNLTGSVTLYKYED